MRLALVMSHADRRMVGARRELHWLAALRRQGVDARMFRMHDEAREDALLEPEAVPACFLPADNPSLPHIHRVSAALRQALAEFQPGLILFKGLGYQVIPDVMAALAPCPFGFIVGGAIADPMLAEAALVLAEHEGQVAGPFAAHAAAGRCLLLPKYFDPALVGDGTPNPDPRFAIINVGVFHGPRKNQAALLPLARRHWVLCVGGGPDMAALQAQAPYRMRFAGHRPQDYVFARMRESRLMVHPALHDGLPRAVIEAMACGLPVVAYRDVIPGGIRHGENGLLVTPETLEAEVDALLADPDRLAAMGAAARRDAFACHGPAAIARAADDFLALLDRLGLR
ncbi:glycosyltransferase family 4 protein [Roseomonas sp. F4]